MNYNHLVTTHKNKSPCFMRHKASCCKSDDKHDFPWMWSFTASSFFTRLKIHSLSTFQNNSDTLIPKIARMKTFSQTLNSSLITVFILCQINISHTLLTITSPIATLRQLAGVVAHLQRQRALPRSLAFHIWQASCSDCYFVFGPVWITLLDMYLVPGSDF